MPNRYYNEDYEGREFRRAEAADITAEFRRVERAFDNLPALEQSSRVITAATAVPGFANLYTFESNGGISVWPPPNGTLVTIDSWSEPNTGPAFLLHAGASIYSDWPDITPLTFPADAEAVDQSQPGLIGGEAEDTGRLLTDNNPMEAGDLSKVLELQYVQQTATTGYWEVLTRVSSAFDRDVEGSIDAVGLPAIATVTVHGIPEAPVPANPLQWPIHPDGVFFKNNSGPPKILICTVYQGSRQLTVSEHEASTFQWMLNGGTFDRAISGIPEGYRQTNLRYLFVAPGDIAAGDSDQFSCQVTFEA